MQTFKHKQFIDSDFIQFFVIALQQFEIKLHKEIILFA